MTRNESEESGAAWVNINPQAFRNALAAMLLVGGHAAAHHAFAAPACRCRVRDWGATSRPE